MTPDEYKGQDNQMLRNLGGWKFGDVDGRERHEGPGQQDDRRRRARLRRRRRNGTPGVAD